MKQPTSFVSDLMRQGVSGLVMCAFALVVCLGLPGMSWAGDEDSSPGNEAALGLGSGLLTFVYLPAKIVYAALGGIVGGFTYALTGGDMDTAKSVWEPSVYGTYVITPDHLKGNDAVRFFGSSPYDEPYLVEKMD
jgi:hypothetical protein